MSAYAVQFVWPHSVKVLDEPRRVLCVDTLEAAKFEAAILFADAARMRRS